MFFRKPLLVEKLVGFERRVLARVVTEVEASALMDRAA
jgi:hypothetical protein